VVGRIRYTPTGIAQGDGATPGGFRLFQNFPNPFNPKTVISYSIPSMTGRDPRLSSAGDQPVSAVGNVVLRIFNVLGSEAAVLVNKRQSPGTYSLTFDASGLASGVYFYRLEYGGKVQTRTMVFLR
jgi:hypothetical protein